MSSTRSPGQLMTIETVIERCRGSKNVCDIRKAHDLEHVRELATGLWKDRLIVEGLFGTPDLSLAIICRLRVMGLIWNAGRAVPRDSFRLLLLMPHNYPLSIPRVQFVTEIPFCPHVVHASFLPPVAGLPADLQTYLRMGQGQCCFVRAGQWSRDPDCDSATVLWQVSRILCLDVMFGEKGSLNASARETAIRMRDEGKTPLGLPLPLPGRSEVAGQGVLPVGNSGENSDAITDIEWIEDENHR